MNNLTITGRLGRDPEAFEYGSDGKGARFSVAVDNPFGEKGDDGKPKPDWFQVSVFGQSADFALQYLAKGREVCATGDVHLDEWEKKREDGTVEHRASLSLRANRVEAIGPKQEGAKPRQQAAPKPQAAAPAQGPDIDWTMEGEEDPFEDE